MTNPFVAIHRSVWRTVNDTIHSLRRQAPGARMVGEFAVKHAVNEAQRRLRPDEPPAPSSDGSGDTPT